MANGIGVFQRRQNSPIIIAQSGVAASVTGTLTETTLATITIPGGSMGPNGSLRITTLVSVTNNANNKALTTKLGGTSMRGIGYTTIATVQDQTNIRNRNSLASQVSYAGGASLGSGSAVALTTAAVDTSVDKALTITGTLANIADTITLEGYTVEVLPSA